MPLSLPATSQLVSEGLSVRKIINLLALSIASAFILVCCSVSIFGQNRGSLLSLRKQAGINAVTGQAAMHAKGEPSGNSDDHRRFTGWRSCAYST